MLFFPQQRCITQKRGSPSNLFQSTARLGNSNDYYHTFRVFYETTVCGKRSARPDRQVEISDSHKLNPINAKETILPMSRSLRNTDFWSEVKGCIVS